MQEQYTRSRAQLKAEARSLLQQLKSTPCLDCGGTFPPQSMHYDHRDPLSKIHDVSRLAALGRLDEMLSEIEKCDLVCANCHATRTVEQRRLGVLKMGSYRVDVAASKPGQRRLVAVFRPRRLSPMMSRGRSADAPPGYETLAAAANRYGVSERTLRRRIEAGELEAERLPRPQGSVIFVKLPPGAEPMPTESPPTGGTATNYSEEAKGGDQAAPPDYAVWLETWSGVVERVLDDNKAQAERIAELEREVGRLSGIEEVVKGQAETINAYGELRGEWLERANEQRRRAERAEAELERLKARSWWDKLRGR
jgi:hypothetical protein